VSARLARSIYQTICSNQAAIADIKAEAASLALSLATDPDASFELTSSTVNGQTFSGRRTMSNGDRLTMLRLILKQVDAGRPLNLDTRAVF
jgi:hypothetical protein